MQKMNIAEFYPAKLKKDITRFNAEIDAVENQRAAVDSDRAALLQAATAGTLKNPARLLDEAQALRARAVACDHAELVLLNQKPTFKADINAARDAERSRVMAQAETRRETLRAQLAAIVPGTRYAQGVMNEDPELISLIGRAESLRHNITDQERVEIGNDRDRAAELAQKLAQILQ